MTKGIILASFGTTNEETRKKCIESIEKRVIDEFEDIPVLRAFTSRVVINILKKRDNYRVKTITEALKELFESGKRDIFIQPLLILKGIEYEKILREARDFIKEYDCNIRIGKPLLSSDEDYSEVACVLDINEESTVFMGHGTEHNIDESYNKLEKILREENNQNIFLGTIEGNKTIKDVIKELKVKDIKSTVLRPFMLVSGVHVLEDMLSEDEDSWKSLLEKNDIKVNTKTEGLGEIEGIQNIFINHLKEIYV